MIINEKIPYYFQWGRPGPRKLVILRECFIKRGDIKRCWLYLIIISKKNKFSCSLKMFDKACQADNVSSLPTLPCRPKVLFRVNMGDMTLVYKILNGSLEGVQWRDFFQMADSSRLRGHFLKLKKERSRLDLRKFTFSQRVVNMWNDLPAGIVTAPATKVFKRLLEAKSPYCIGMQFYSLSYISFAATFLKVIP